MIVMVAPYSPIGRTNSPHLGASRKIELVLSGLTRFGEVVLINTAHNERSRPLCVEKIEINGVAVVEVKLNCYAHSVYGKVLNLLEINSVIKVIDGIGIPSLVWLYNGYAFESMFLKAAKKNWQGIKSVLEFEDWHFSRSRGMNPKPYIDFIFWKRSLSLIDCAFVVNESLKDKVNNDVSLVYPLYGLIDPSLEEMSASIVCGGDVLNVGYFGGLSKEKGADLVLRLSKECSREVQFHVCGAGSLDDEFEVVSQRDGSNLSFYGRVSTDELYRVMSGCQLILNPHSSIESMDNGVFPFKVVEAVAAGAVLISTKLPDSEIDDLLCSTIFFDGSIEGLKQGMDQYQNDVSGYVGKVELARDAALGAFSLNNVMEKVGCLLGDSNKDH